MKKTLTACLTWIESKRGDLLEARIKRLHGWIASEEDFHAEHMRLLNAELAYCLDARMARAGGSHQANENLSGALSNSHTARSEDVAPYNITGCDPAVVDLVGVERDVIDKALIILASRMNSGMVMDSPSVVRDFLRLKIGGLPHEVFVVIFMDSQNRVIATEEMFRGTLTQTSVYPREVAKAALAHNASAVVLAHNHPSGKVEPSRADELLTQTLKSSLGLVDVRVLDHFVVGAAEVVSFAERGLL